tara:strand:+ start:2102 stop:2317 length:216 start_codon:yes stop_codon:yes gene_type:complete
MSRIETQDLQAIMNVRQALIEDHERLLDGAGAPASSLVKQRDVALAFSRAIRSLEEILQEAGGIKFQKPTK